MAFGIFGGQFIDVIEWTDDTSDTMVYRFERQGNEIKYGAMLTVREGQVAVMVNEGEVADVFDPGLWQLETANLPVLSTLQSWKYGFNSPFKCEVYFINTKRFSDLKWGTKNPIMLRDAEFGPVRLRAFGTYEIRVSDPVEFLREVVGTDGRFSVDEVSNQLRNLIVSRVAVGLGKAKIPALDLAANYMELGDFLTNLVGPDFAAYGLNLQKLLIENISLPPNVEEALDKRSSMGVIGDLNKYMKFQAAESLTADGEAGGAAATGAGMGMGLAMAQQMAAAFSPSGGASPAAAAAPPPLPSEPSYYMRSRADACMRIHWFGPPEWPPGPARRTYPPLRAFSTWLHHRFRGHRRHSSCPNRLKTGLISALNSRKYP